MTGSLYQSKPKWRYYATDREAFEQDKKEIQKQYPFLNVDQMQYRSSRGTNLKTFRRRSFVKNQRSRPIIRTSNMAHPDLIEQKMSAAEAAWTIGNDGKARVCARRAVAVAHEAWLARHAIHIGRWDAMGHLRRIHADESVPQSVREAAERLTTSVPRRDSAPFTSDPIGDERRIIAHLAAG